MIGPALPPHLQAERAAQRDGDGSHNGRDDDDVPIGPSLPIESHALPNHQAEEGLNDAIARFEGRYRQAERGTSAADIKDTGRPEWMLAPPKGGADSVYGIFGGGGGSGSVGKLTNRTFQSGRGARLAGSGGDNQAGANLWTETPEERQARMRDEEMGVRPKANEPKAVEDEEPDERNDEMRKQVQKYNDQYRGQSLVKAHEKDGRSTDRHSHKDRKHSHRHRSRSRSRSPGSKERKRHRHRDKEASPSHTDGRHHKRHDRHKNEKHESRTKSREPQDPQDPLDKYRSSELDRKVDNASARAFDYEKDVLGTTKRMSMSQRDQVIAKSMDLGGRFANSKFL